MHIGILGAGKLGTVLGRHAIAAGHEVTFAGSGEPETIDLIVRALVPGAATATGGDVAKVADVVILALPLRNFRQLPADALAGALVVDAMNYWWETDGHHPELAEANSSRLVQDHLAQSRVVKAFNHMGYHDLDEGPRTGKAIAVAGMAKGTSKRWRGSSATLGSIPCPCTPSTPGLRCSPDTPRSVRM